MSSENNDASEVIDGSADAVDAVADSQVAEAAVLKLPQPASSTVSLGLSADRLNPTVDSPTDEASSSPARPVATSANTAASAFLTFGNKAGGHRILDREKSCCSTEIDELDDDDVEEPPPGIRSPSPRSVAATVQEAAAEVAVVGSSPPQPGRKGGRACCDKTLHHIMAQRSREIESRYNEIEQRDRMNALMLRPTSLPKWSKREVLTRVVEACGYLDVPLRLPDEGCQPEDDGESGDRASGAGAKRRRGMTAAGLCAAVAEERGLSYRIVETVIDSVMSMTSDNVRKYGSCELGGSIKLTLKIESYGDDAIPASGTWILREGDVQGEGADEEKEEEGEEEKEEDGDAPAGGGGGDADGPVLPTTSPILILDSLY